MHSEKIYFCITDNMFHIGINANNDNLKFKLNEPLTSKTCKKIEDDILLIKDIINILGLDELKFSDSF